MTVERNTEAALELDGFGFLQRIQFQSIPEKLAMSVVFEIEKQIDKPRSVVWDTLTNWEQATEWMNGVDEFRASGPTIPGTVLSFKMRGRECSMTVEECEQGSCIVLKSIQGKMTTRHRFALSEIDANRTRITLTASTSTESPIAGFLMGVFSPILKMAGKRADGSQLASLKKLIEAD